MKLTESILKRLILEELENKSSSLEQAKEILKKNPYMSHLADGLTEENLVDIGQGFLFVLSDDTFTHARNSHSAVSDLPGSKFNNVDDQTLMEIIKKVVSLKKPDETENRNGSNIYKWFNVDMGENVGKDSLVTPKEAAKMGTHDYSFFEKIGNKRAIPNIIAQGLEVVDSQDQNAQPISSDQPIEDEKTYYIRQPLKVVYGPQKDTKLVTLIMAELGIVDGKKLVSLMTVFPGYSDPKFRNKQDYIKAGFAFIKPKSAAISESMIKKMILQELGILKK